MHKSALKLYWSRRIQARLATRSAMPSRHLSPGWHSPGALIINQIYGAGSSFAETMSIDSLPRGAAYAFLGPLIGAAVRAAWGPLCDKFGGAIWTFIGGLGMTIFTAVA